MGAQSTPKLPLVAALLFAALGCIWLLAISVLAHNLGTQIVLSALFIAVGAIAIYRFAQRGVEEERTVRRRQRIDILWRFAGEESADFSARATAALEVSARVLGLESAAVVHVAENAFALDLIYGRDGDHAVDERSGLIEAIGSLAIAGGKTIAFPDLASSATARGHAQALEHGARAYIGTPFSVGSAEFALSFWSKAPRATPFDEEDREYVRVLGGFIAGIFRQRRQEEEMAQLALFDGLTGLANRANLLDRLRAAIAAHRRRDAQCALLVINLNRFRQINDVLGYSAGDRALVAYSKRLAGVLRAEDSLARVGGDHFAVVTSLAKSPTEVVSLAERLGEAAAEPLHVDGHTFHIDASIGISVFPTDGHDPKAMLDHADAAANRAKEEGSGVRYLFYSTEISQSVRSRQELFNDLRNAVDLREFALHFQPQVDLRTGEIAGAEALLRWQHTSRGLVAPGSFVPAAEEQGLMVPIGTWVLQEALLQWRGLLDQNPEMHLAINVSARQFSDPDFYDRLNGALEAARVAPHRIVIEITETVAMADPGSTRSILLRCKDLGLLVALDDFGTLYSSLAYLKTLPIDIIKIDKSFVDGLPHDPFDAAIVHAVISLGHALNCSIVAEGVEKEEQAAWLAQAGCQFAQGFLYSKGLPYEQFVSWLTAPQVAT